MQRLFQDEVVVKGELRQPVNGKPLGHGRIVTTLHIAASGQRVKGHREDPFARIALHSGENAKLFHQFQLKPGLL